MTLYEKIQCEVQTEGHLYTNKSSTDEVWIDSGPEVPLTQCEFGEKTDSQIRIMCCHMKGIFTCMIIGLERCELFDFLQPSQVLFYAAT